MNSLTFRRMVVVPVLRVLMAVVSVFSGEFGRSRRVESPNARITLRRFRDVRQGETRLLAERLGSAPLELGLIGIEVRIQRTDDGFALYGQRGAVVGNLVAVESGAELLFRCCGPGMGQLVYVLDRVRLGTC